MPSRFPSSFLDELRSRTDIVKLISGYVSLKKNGRKYWGLCPFHGEKTASFSVDPEHQLYYCFGCKAGGSAIGFTMEIERMDFNEAVTFLAEQARMPIPELENSEEYERRKSQRERLLEANRQAARFYHQTLFSPDGADSLEYLRKRGLSDGIIRKFGLGAAPSGWDKLTTYLTGQGFTEEELQLAGLTVIKNAASSDGSAGRPKRAFDMFRNRAVFPIIDQYGNVLAFGGRALGDQQPKYLNTSDTPVFNKRKGVYAANLLRKERHLDRVILVEGYMDVVSLTQFGVTGVCATLGTALTNEQARLLRKFAPCVYLAYDGDSAGQHAILRGLDIMAEENIPVRVLDFPDKLDPDEFIRRDGPEAFSRLPAISPETYRIRRLKDENDLSTRDGKVTFAKAAASIISGLDPVEREGYIEDLCIQTGFSRDVLLEQIGITAITKTKVDSSEKKEKRIVRKTISDAASEEEVSAQEILLSLIATGLLPEDIVTEEDFEDQELKLIYASLKSGHSVPSILDQAPDEASRSRYARILTSPVVESTDEMIVMANDCINSMRRKSLEKRLKMLQSEISSCRDTSAKFNLLSKYQELQTARNKLKQYTDERAFR